MPSKKTIPVRIVLEKANEALNCDHIPQEVKRGITTLLHEILHETGNYRGYMHSQPRDVGFEERPWDEEDRKTEYTRTYNINPDLLK